jgi:hypothetical protein
VRILLVLPVDTAHKVRRVLDAEIRVTLESGRGLSDSGWANADLVVIDPRLLRGAHLREPFERTRRRWGIPVIVYIPLISDAIHALVQTHGRKLLLAVVGGFR